jgi:hypothetical protein
MIMALIERWSEYNWRVRHLCSRLRDDDATVRAVDDGGGDGICGRRGKAGVNDDTIAGSRVY